MKRLFRILISLVFIILVFKNFSLGGGVKGLADERSPILPQLGAPLPVPDPSAETKIGISRQTCETITSRISSSTDDAEQRVDIGTMYLINSVLQMFRSINSNGRLMYWGLRFTNINVPQGASIQSATITYRAQASSNFDDPSGHTFYGQADDNPSTFTATPSNISVRARTSASVDWVVPKWTSNTDFASPDLSTIIQEIVNRSGWKSNNALVIIGQTTVAQNRVAHSFDSPDFSAFAPLLSISYCINDGYSIGDLVWEDDGDGIQETGEPGVGNVPVTLYTSAGLQVSQVLSDANGQYDINDVIPGEYYLQFGLPGNYSYTLKEQGADTALDSNPDPGTGQTAIFAWNNTASDLDFDAGLIHRYVSKSIREVTAIPDPVSDCCQEYQVSQTVSASLPPGSISPSATLLTLTDTLSEKFKIVPGSISGCKSSSISTDGKMLTCGWAEQTVSAATTITYRARKASAAAVTTSGSYATHISGTLQYSDHQGLPVMLTYGAGTTTAYLLSSDDCQGDIEIEKMLLGEILVPGEQGVYHFEVTNNSEFPLTGFTIFDDLDPLLTFVSAVPSICIYEGIPGVTYGGVVTCETSAVLAQGGIYQVDLTVLNPADAETYPGFNSATVECPWCIADHATDSEAEPTAVIGPVNFSARYAGGILVSWHTLNEQDLWGFDLYRSTTWEGKVLVYRVAAENPFQLIGASYAFIDRNTSPGIEYAYRLYALWSDGSISLAATTGIRGPYREFLPIAWR